jgi:mannan endo-1,4-beta-mannosidase
MGDTPRYKIAEWRKADKQTQDWYRELARLQNQGILFGQHEASLTGCEDSTGAPWNNISRWRKGESLRDTDICRVAKRFPTAYGFDFAWFVEPTFYKAAHVDNAKGATKGLLDEIGTRADARKLHLDLVKRHHREGAVIAFSWHTVNPVIDLIENPNPADYTDTSRFFTRGSSPSSTIVLNEDRTLPEVMRKKLDEIASFANDAKAADGSKIPIVFRPYHENNLKFFWWGSPVWNQGTPLTDVEKGYVEQYRKDFRDLWRETVKYLILKGVTNFLYAYSPNVQTARDLFRADFVGTRPDDEWVDIFGIDFYPKGSPFAGLVDQVGEVYAQAKDRGKLAAVTESGLLRLTRTPKDKPKEEVRDYWTKEFAKLLSLREGGEDVLLSYAMIWKNLKNDSADPGENEHYGPYPGHFSAEDFVKMADGYSAEVGTVSAFRRQFLFLVLEEVEVAATAPGCCDCLR